MAASNPKTIEPLFPIPENFSEIFDFIPDVNFYLKDRDSRWRACNSAALASFNARTTEDILGRSELELFPLHIAEPILKDDRHVMDTGQPIVNKMEVVVDEHGHLVWVTTTKLPTRSTDGSITGIMGITRILRRTEMLPEGYRQFSKAVCFIQENYSRVIDIKELARLCCLSDSQFRKKFRKLFRTSPQDFILGVRMQAAARLLVSTDQPIVEIALKSGFCDQSYFTRKFSMFLGDSPKKYRDRWQGQRRGKE